jgi:hypothetical protein
MTRRVISYDQINPEGEETSSTQEVNLTGKRKQEEDSGGNFKNMININVCEYNII